MADTSSNPYEVLRCSNVVFLLLVRGRMNNLTRYACRKIYIYGAEGYSIGQVGGGYIRPQNESLQFFFCKYWLSI